MTSRKVAAWACSLLLEVGRAWSRAGYWYRSPFRAGLTRGMIERLAIAGPASLLLWACWVSVEQRTVLAGLPALALAVALFLMSTLVVGSVVLVRFWRAEDAQQSLRVKPRSGFPRVAWMAALAAFYLSPVWIVWQLSGEAHDVWQAIQAEDHRWAWIFLPLLMALPLLRAYVAFGQWLERREAQRDRVACLAAARHELQIKADMSRGLLAEMAPLAAEDRLSARSLASLVGIEIGAELPNDLDAAGYVIRALLRDPNVVALDVAMDHASLERAFEARQQLRSAYIDRSFEPRLSSDPGEP